MTVPTTDPPGIGIRILAVDNHVAQARDGRGRSRLDPPKCSS
jgi:hypothetical protein